MTLSKNQHSIGKTISALRKEHGWTQAELAEKLQVSDKAVSKWEKDKGSPGLEFFPVLARLFGVTIDYIMTGNTPKPEVVFLSKLELCAKTDDVSLLGNFTASTTDENKVCLRDYIFKYKSYKVLRALLLRCTSLDSYANVVIPPKPSRSIIPFGLVLYYGILTETLPLLKSLINKRYPSHHQCFQAQLDMLTKKDLKTDDFSLVFTLLAQRPDLSKKYHDDLFAKWKQQIFYEREKVSKSLWAFGIAELLNHAARYRNTGVFDAYFSYIKSINEESIGFITAIKKRSDCNTMDCYGVTPLYYERLKHPYITFELETIKYFLDIGDVETAQTLDDFNALYEGERLDPDELRVAKLKKDTSLSDDELAVQAAIHNGVLYINELLALKKVDVIKTALFAYPIHTVELLLKWLQENNLRALFRWAVDSGDAPLQRAIVNGDSAAMEEETVKYYKIATASSKANQKFLKVTKQTKTGPRDVCLAWCPAQKERLLEFFKDCKNQISDEISLAIENEAIVAELSKDFFEKALENGNVELVIIKLCVRLESSLKSKYHYTGDFSDMITRYCNEHLQWEEDDGWGYTVHRADDKKIVLLHKLRQQRNSIVHADKKGDTMTVAELKECINLVCAIN